MGRPESTSRGDGGRGVRGACMADEGGQRLGGMVKDASTELGWVAVIGVGAAGCAAVAATLAPWLHPSAPSPSRRATTDNRWRGSRRCVLQAIERSSRTRRKGGRTQHTARSGSVDGVPPRPRRRRLRKLSAEHSNGLSRPVSQPLAEARRDAPPPSLSSQRLPTHAQPHQRLSAPRCPHQPVFDHSSCRTPRSSARLPSARPPAFPLPFRSLIARHVVRQA